jgi:glycerol-3-phosphate acyltransferase PlsY
MATAQLIALQGPVGVGLCLVGGYLLGSIPFGYLAARAGGAGDIRQVGSGNIGATNVLRTGRRDLAAITLVGDGGKGAVAVLLAAWLLGGSTYAAVAGGGAFVGHLFPVWLGFKGGKGVATFFGVLLAIAWPVGVIAGAVWIAMAAVFRMSSLASLTAAALAPVIAVLARQETPTTLLAVAMAVLIVIRHRANISRLLRNQEPRIGRAKPAA